MAAIVGHIDVETINARDEASRRERLRAMARRQLAPVRHRVNQEVFKYEDLDAIGAARIAAPGDSPEAAECSRLARRLNNGLARKGAAEDRRWAEYRLAQEEAEFREAGRVFARLLADHPLAPQ